MRTVEQAGAIVVRGQGDTRRVLLLTAKRNPAHWLFPKGHVEAGERLEETALREAEEEAGIRGTIIDRAGTLSFELDSALIHVHYFVVTTDDEGRPEAGRRLEWCSYDQALDRLTFNDTRGLLRKVWRTFGAR